MSSEKTKEMINGYFDNELDKSEEVYLFTQLSQIEEARTYFKQMNVLSENITNTFEEIPLSLEENILTATVDGMRKRNKFSFNIQSVIGYALAVVLLIISITIYSESIQYKKDIEMNIKQISHQNQMLEMMFYALPQAEVKGKLDDEIIIRPTI